MANYAPILLACVLVVFAIVTKGSIQAQEPSPAYDAANVPVPQQPPSAALAANLYAQRCAPCHGITGEGGGPASIGTPMEPTIFAEPQAIWERSPAELLHTTKFGRIEKLMPPWRNNLNDDQIWQVVYYAWDLHTDEEEVAAGAALYAHSCAICHGQSGRGDGPTASTEMPDFSAQASMIFTSQAQLAQGWESAHPEPGANWSASQRQATLAYIRTFSYQPAWVSPLQTGLGVIEGQMRQATAGGLEISQGTVTLNIYQQTELLTTRAAPVDVNGRFRFEELPTDSGYYFLLETEYSGIRYTSPILAFSGPDFTEFRVGPDHLDTVLPVYETTTDGSGVYINRANWVVEHEPGSLLIGQGYTFGNRSDRTFIGSEAETGDIAVTLAVPLDPQAQNVNFQDGEVGDVYRQSGQVVYDTRPVRPGADSHRIFLRYRLPFDGNAAAISFPVTDEIHSLNLLVSELAGLEVTLADDTLPFVGQETIQGVQFQHWSGSVAAGDGVRMTFRGLIPAGSQDPRQGNEMPSNRELPIAAPPLNPRIPLALGGVVGMVLLGVLMVFWRREKVASNLTPEQLAARRQELSTQIARLDDLHALGELHENTWQGKRRRLKRELLAIAQHEKDTESVL